MDIYKSARQVTASGSLQKNKGVMLVGAAGDGCQLRLKGLSLGNWVNYTAGLTLGAAGAQIIPVQVYGVTLGTGALFELN